jgi:hypothetical protein
MFWPRRQGAQAAAKAPSVTVFDVRKGTEALLQFEARHGCTGQVESMLDDVRGILDGEILYSTTTAEEIEQVWINLLRLGMLDDLLSLIRRTDLPFLLKYAAFWSTADGNTTFAGSEGRRSAPSTRTAISSRWAASYGAGIHR